MKLPLVKPSLAVIVYLIPTAMLAQQVTYLDENYKPATAASYKYKRVLKYTGEVINPNFRLGLKGRVTTGETLTGLKSCSLTDYYQNGGLALVVNLLSKTKDCKDPVFNGQAVSYYPDGHIHEKAYYDSGRLQGDDITYNEDGSIRNTDYYHNGAKLDTKRFAVSPNNPLLGTWKCVRYSESPVRGLPPRVEETMTGIFFENGTLEVSGVRNSVKANWKYTSKSAMTGVLEEYWGTDLLNRGDITWFNRNKFECVITFSQVANNVGMRFAYDRQ